MTKASYGCLSAEAGRLLAKRSLVTPAGYFDEIDAKKTWQNQIVNYYSMLGFDMRVVKSISLPVDLAKKAESFDNLSLYVQDAINFGIEHNLDAYQKSRLYLSKENQEMDDLLHEIVDIILNPKKMYPSDKLKKIKKALVNGEWIVLNEEAKS